jgi:hypothetical protein
MKKQIHKLPRPLSRGWGPWVQWVRNISTKKLLEGIDTLGLSTRSIRNAVAEAVAPCWSKSGRSFIFFCDKGKSSETSANDNPRFLSPAEQRSLYMNKAKAKAEAVVIVETEEKTQEESTEDWSYIKSGADF